MSVGRYPRAASCAHPAFRPAVPWQCSHVLWAHVRSPHRSHKHRWDMQRAPEGLWRLWSSDEGVLMRVHECVKRWNNHGKLIDTNCMQRERFGREIATSLLRHDLPQATFEYVYNESAFSAGWILDPRSAHVHVAFPHDSWSGSNYRTRRKCPPRFSAEDYARRRALMELATFIKSPYNCFVRNISVMVAMQQAFCRGSGNCSINQVQVTYSEKDIVGVFYRGVQWKQYAIRASRLVGGVPVVALDGALNLNGSRPSAAYLDRNCHRRK